MRRCAMMLASFPRTAILCVGAMMLSVVLSIPGDERLAGEHISAAETTLINESALDDDPDCPEDPLGQIGDEYWYECWDHAQDCWGHIVERSSSVEITELGCDAQGDCRCSIAKASSSETAAAAAPAAEKHGQKRYLETTDSFKPISSSGYCQQWCGYAMLKNGDGEEYYFKIYTLMRYRPFEPIRVKYVGHECQKNCCTTWHAARWTEPDETTPKFRHEINVTVGTKPNVPITFVVTTRDAVIEKK